MFWYCYWERCSCVLWSIKMCTLLCYFIKVAFSPMSNGKANEWCSLLITENCVKYTRREKGYIYEWETNCYLNLDTIYYVNIFLITSRKTICCKHQKTLLIDNAEYKQKLSSNCKYKRLISSRIIFINGVQLRGKFLRTISSKSFLNF